MLKDKVVVITGGAGLLGRSFANVVVENHGNAIIVDIDRVKGQEVCQQLNSQYSEGRVDYVQTDITSRESLGSLITTLNHRYSRIDALVNNAYPRNKNFGRHFFEVDYADFCENIGLNLGGYFLSSQQFAKYFRNQGYGNIINVASIYGVIPPRFDIYDGTTMTVAIEYAASKSALIHLTKYMAKYFKGLDIRVNALSPGGIFDGQPEPFLNAYRNHCIHKGMLDGGDLQGALLFLLSEMSEYVNGQNIIVDDGFTL